MYCYIHTYIYMYAFFFVLISVGSLRLTPNIYHQPLYMNTCPLDGVANHIPNTCAHDMHFIIGANAID